MTMTERDRARVGDKLFASSNGNGALRCELRRESAGEWAARTGLPLPSRNEDAASTASTATPAPLPASAGSGSDDEDDEADIHPGQLMKVLALEIDKPAAKASRQTSERSPRRLAGTAPASAPQPPSAAKTDSDSESSCDSCSSESESDSEDEVALGQLRQVKKKAETIRAELAPALTLPELDSVNTSLSDGDRSFVEFGEAELLSSRAKDTAAPGVLVGDHCETAVQALAVHQVVTEATKKVLWFAKNPSRLAQGLRAQFAPVAGFGVHTLQTLPIAGQVGVPLHGGAVCCSYRDLVTLHKSSSAGCAADDSETAALWHLMRWLRADDTADVMLLFSNCDEVLSRSWKGVEEKKWTQMGAAFRFIQQQHPLAGVVYVSSAHRTCAAQLVHMDRLTVLWGPADAPGDSDYWAVRETFAERVHTASLKLPSRLPFWEIAIPLVCSQRVPPLLAAGQTDILKLPNRQTVEPANEAELRSWTRDSQEFYWARRRKHWEKLRLAKLQSAARQAKLWDAGSAQMLRDRLLRSEFDPDSLFPPEVKAPPSPRSGAETAIDLPDDLEVMKNTEPLQAWPQATVDPAASTRLLELAELLFRLSDFLGLQPFSRHQLATVIEQKAERTQAVAAVTRDLFESLLSRITTGGPVDMNDVETARTVSSSLPSKEPNEKKKQKTRKASSIWSVRVDKTEEIEEMFDVEAILESRDGRLGGREYLVKWEGFEEEDNTWEPAANLSNAQDLIDAFERKKQMRKSNELMTPRCRPAPDLSQYPDEGESTCSDAFEARHGPLEADEKEENGRAAMAAAHAAEPWENRLVMYCKTHLPEVEVEPVPTVRAIVAALDNNGYASLSGDHRLTLLNFIVTEVLCQDEFAGSGALLEEGAAAEKANRIAERRLKKAVARKRALPEYRQDAEADYFQAVNGALATRLEPLGTDRWRRNYWWLQSDPGRIWVHSPLKYPVDKSTDSQLPEDRDNSWAYYDSVIQVDRVLACLDSSGARERHLSCSLKRVYRRVCRSMQQHGACNEPWVRLSSGQLVEQIALDEDNRLEKALDERLLIVDTLNDCVEKVGAAARRQEPRAAREKRRQAKAAMSKQQERQQVLANANAAAEETSSWISPRPAAAPQVPRGSSVHWCGEREEWYYVDNASRTSTWDRPAFAQNRADTQPSKSEDLVTDGDFLCGVQQVAGSVGDSDAAAQFEKIYQMWVHSKIVAQDELGDVDLRQMAASRYLAYRASWPSAGGGHECNTPGLPPVKPCGPPTAPDAGPLAADAPLIVPRSVRASVEKVVKALEKDAKKAEKELARQTQREAKQAAKQSKVEEKQAERLAKHLQRDKMPTKLARPDDDQAKQPRPDAPEGWTAIFSSEHNEWYFWNEELETSTWTPELSHTTSDPISTPSSPSSPQAPVVERSVASAVEKMVKKLEKEAKKIERQKVRSAKKAARRAAKQLKKEAAVRAVSESDSDDDLPIYLRKEKLRIESRASAELHQPTSFDVNPFAPVHRASAELHQPTNFDMNPFALVAWATRAKQNKTRRPTARKKHPAAVTACVERLIKDLEVPEKEARLEAQKAAKAERDAIKADKARLRECGKVCAQLVKDVVLSFPKEYSAGDARSTGWLKAKEQEELLAQTEKRRSSRTRKKRKIYSPSDSEDDDVPIMRRNSIQSKRLSPKVVADRKRNADTEATPSVRSAADVEVDVPNKKQKKSKNSKNAAGADDKAAVDHGIYRCVKKAVVRSDAALSSKKVGRLKPGDVFKALEVRAVDGQLRVRGPLGWASLRSLGGNNLLEKLSGTAVGESLQRKRDAAAETPAAPPTVDADKLTKAESQQCENDIAVLTVEQEEIQRIAGWPSSVTTEIVITEAGEVEGDAEQMIADMAELLGKLDANSASAPMPVTLFPAIPAVETTAVQLHAPVDSAHAAEDAEVAAVATRCVSNTMGRTANSPAQSVVSVPARPSNPTPYAQGQSNDALQHRVEQEQEQEQSNDTSATAESVEITAVQPDASTQSVRPDVKQTAKPTARAPTLPQRRMRRGFAVLESDSDSEDEMDSINTTTTVAKPTNSISKPLTDDLKIEKKEHPVCSAASPAEPKAVADTPLVLRTAESSSTVPQLIVRRDSGPFLSPSAPERSQLADKPGHTNQAELLKASGSVPTSAGSSLSVARDVTDEFGDMSFLADFDLDSAVAAATAAAGAAFAGPQHSDGEASTVVVD